jgi:hypothetical protein
MGNNKCMQTTDVGTAWNAKVTAWEGFRINVTSIAQNRAAHLAWQNGYVSEESVVAYFKAFSTTE